MIGVTFLPEARVEMLEASEYYDSKLEGLGDRFLNEVDRALAVILQAPNRWPRQYRYFRKYRLDDFPYGVFYGVLPTEVVIVAVAHLHRRPGYWLNRWRR